MTTLEMVQKIAEHVAVANKDIEKVLDQFVIIAQKTLKTSDKVSLTGLGSFTPKEMKARIGRNPKTGGKVNISAKKVVKFKPGKELVEILQMIIPQQ